MKLFSNTKNELREKSLPEWLYSFFLAFNFKIFTAIPIAHARIITEAISIHVIYTHQTTTLAGTSTSCINQEKNTDYFQADNARHTTEWDSNTERETERQRETERDRERLRERARQTDRHTEKERQREKKKTLLSALLFIASFLLPETTYINISVPSFINL